MRVCSREMEEREVRFPFSQFLGAALLLKHIKANLLQRAAGGRWQVAGGSNKFPSALALAALWPKFSFLSRTGVSSGHG